MLRYFRKKKRKLPRDNAPSVEVEREEKEESEVDESEIEPEEEEDVVSHQHVVQDSTWANVEFAGLVDEQIRRKSSSFVNQEFELDLSTSDAQLPVIYEFDETGTDKYGNMHVRPTTLVLMQSLLEDLATNHEKLMHQVLGYCEPKTMVPLSQLSQTMRSRLRGAPLRLEMLTVTITQGSMLREMPRVLRLGDIEQPCAEVEIDGIKGPKWTVIGVLSGVSDIRALFRAIVPEKLELLGLVGSPLQNMSLLNRCTNLTRLELHNTIQLNSLESIQTLTTLKSLHLSKCQVLEDISPLAHLVNLTKVYMYECPNIGDISPMRSLSRLSHFGIHYSQKLNNFDAYRSWELLEVVELTRCIQLNNLEFLRNMTHLTHLDVSECTTLNDISALADSARTLKTLKLTNCRAIPNIDCLSVCRDLEVLRMEKLDLVEDLSPLRNCNKLLDLRLNNCAKATGFHTLVKSVPSLLYLSLESCHALGKKDAQVLKHAKCLMQFEVLGTSPTFLAHILISDVYNVRKTARKAIVLLAQSSGPFREVLHLEILPRVFANIDWTTKDTKERDTILATLADLAKESKVCAESLVDTGLLNKLLPFVDNTNTTAASMVAGSAIILPLIENTQEGSDQLDKANAVEMFARIVLQKGKVEINNVTTTSIRIIAAMLGATHNREEAHRVLQETNLLGMLAPFLAHGIDPVMLETCFGLFVNVEFSLITDKSFGDLVFKQVLESLKHYNGAMKGMSARLLPHIVENASSATLESVEANAEELVGLSRELFKSDRDIDHVIGCGLVRALPDSLNHLLLKEVVLFMLAKMDSYANAIQQVNAHSAMNTDEIASHLMVFLRTLQRIVTDEATAIRVGNEIDLAGSILPKVLFTAGDGRSSSFFADAAIVLLRLMSVSDSFKRISQGVYANSELEVAFRLFTRAQSKIDKTLALHLLSHLFDSSDFLTKVYDANPKELADFRDELYEFMFSEVDEVVLEVGAAVIGKAVKSDDEELPLVELLVMPLVQDLKLLDSDDFVAEKARVQEDPTQLDPTLVIGQMILNALAQALQGAPFVEPNVNQTQEEPIVELTEAEKEERIVVQKARRRVKVASMVYFLASLVVDAKAFVAMGCFDAELFTVLYQFLISAESFDGEDKVVHESIIGFFSALVVNLNESLNTQLYNKAAPLPPAEETESTTETLDTEVQLPGLPPAVEIQVVNEDDDEDDDEELNEFDRNLRNNEVVVQNAQREFQAHMVRRMEEDVQLQEQRLEQREKKQALNRKRRMKKLESVSASPNNQGTPTGLNNAAMDVVREKRQAIWDTLCSEGRMDHTMDICIALSHNYSTSKMGAAALALLASFASTMDVFLTKLVMHGEFLAHLDHLLIHDDNEDYLNAACEIVTLLAQHHIELVTDRVIDPLAETIMNGSDSEKRRAMFAVGVLVSNRGGRQMLAQGSLNKSIIEFMGTNKDTQTVLLAASVLRRIVGTDIEQFTRLVEEDSAHFVSLLKGDNSTVSKTMVDILNNVVAPADDKKLELLAKVLVDNGILDVLSDSAHKTDLMLSLTSLVLHHDAESSRDRIQKEELAESIANMLMDKPDAKFAKALTKINSSFLEDSSSTFSELFQKFTPFQEALKLEQEVKLRQTEDQDLVFTRLRGLPQEVSCDRTYQVNFGHTWSTVAVRDIFEFNNPRLYFEVEIIELAGAARIGWISKDFSSGVLKGGLAKAIGDDSSSWGFANDGALWPQGGSSDGKVWQEQDVIGVCADTESGTMQFSVNGDYFGTAFEGLDSKTIATGLRPAISGKDMICSVNLGTKPFKHFPPMSEYFSFASTVVE